MCPAWTLYLSVATLFGNDRNSWESNWVWFRVKCWSVLVNAACWHVNDMLVLLDHDESTLACTDHWPLPPPPLKDSDSVLLDKENGSTIGREESSSRSKSRWGDYNSMTHGSHYSFIQLTVCSSQISLPAQITTMCPMLNMLNNTVIQPLKKL